MARGVLILVWLLADASSARAEAPRWRSLVVKAQPYLGSFRRASRGTGVPLGLLLCVAERESGFRPWARSPVATGIMQVVGGSLDPHENIRQGAKILSDNLRETRGLVFYALLAYAQGRRGMVLAMLATGEPPASVVRYALGILRCAGYRPSTRLHLGGR